MDQNRFSHFQAWPTGKIESIGYQILHIIQAKDEATGYNRQRRETNSV